MRRPRLAACALAAARGGGTPHARTAVCPAQARRRRDETGGRGAGSGGRRAAAACGRWARVAAVHRVGVAPSRGGEVGNERECGAARVCAED